MTKGSQSVVKMGNLMAADGLGQLFTKKII